VIVCSKSNWQELRHLSLPLNVSVLQDVPSDVFETLLRGAKAGIVPLKRDTGASGQSVALAVMRNSKSVIATDAGALREYVEDGVSGFLLRDLAVQLPGVLERMESTSLAAAMGRASRARYEQRFSRHVVEAAFAELLRDT
jgi:glycosyltransferase involved in cell wall biosynthesis